LQPINAYGADKASCELHAAAIARTTGASITGLRFFNVYGPGQDPSSIYSGVVSVFCERLLKGQPVDIYGDGRQTRDFIHVSDVVRALLKVMESPVVGGEVYNVCTGVPLSVAALAKTIAIVCGTRLKTRFHPARDGDIQHSVGDPAYAAAQLDYRAKMSVTEGLGDLISTLAAPGDFGEPTAKIAAQ
jgi:UDP-glucose 4-epimerase